MNCRKGMHQTCPICGVKKLAGMHRKACMRLYPLSWAIHYGVLLSLLRQRCSRVELIERLANLIGVN